MQTDPRQALDKAVHDLPASWSWEWFTDVLDIEGGTQPPAATFVGAPRPGYVRLVQIRDFESDSHLTYIPDSPKWRRCGPTDVLIGRYGAALGRICTGLDGAYNVALAKVVVSERVHLPFAFYLLKSTYFQAPLLASGGRSAQAGFNKDGLSVISLPIPPLSEQRAIAQILGALDNKIELNRKMNGTLKAMVRAIFQSWFVDFDPVREKSERRDPRLPHHIADLFPDSFEESELGEVPRSWKVGEVGELAKLDRDALNPMDFPTETFDHYSLPAFDTGQTPNVELGSAIMSNKFTVTPNSVLLSKLNPHIPRIWMPDLSPSRRSVCSTEFMVMSPRLPVSREYLFSLFTSSTFDSIYGTLVTGTTGSHQRISPESALDIKIVIPPAAPMQAFAVMTKPMFDRINRNAEQSCTLASLRDALLPKLTAGELRVKDLEGLIKSEITGAECR